LLLGLLVWDNLIIFIRVRFTDRLLLLTHLLSSIEMLLILLLLLDRHYTGLVLLVYFIVNELIWVKC
jgi:hypothetical protein